MLFIKVLPKKTYILYWGFSFIIKHVNLLLILSKQGLLRLSLCLLSCSWSPSCWTPPSPPWCTSSWRLQSTAGSPDTTSTTASPTAPGQAAGRLRRSSRTLRVLDATPSLVVALSFSQVKSASQICRDNGGLWGKNLRSRMCQQIYKFDILNLSRI